MSLLPVVRNAVSRYLGNAYLPAPQGTPERFLALMDYQDGDGWAVAGARSSPPFCGDMVGGLGSRPARTCICKLPAVLALLMTLGVMSVVRKLCVEPAMEDHRRFRILRRVPNLGAIRQRRVTNVDLPGPCF
jgi:hypothetical protein